MTWEASLCNPPGLSSNEAAALLVTDDTGLLGDTHHFSITECIAPGHKLFGDLSSLALSLLLVWLSRTQDYILSPQGTGPELGSSSFEELSSQASWDEARETQKVFPFFFFF